MNILELKPLRPEIDFTKTKWKELLGLIVNSHWLSLGPGQGLGPEPGRMGCMVLRRTFHTASEQEQGTWTGTGKNGFMYLFSGPGLEEWVMYLFSGGVF